MVAEYSFPVPETIQKMLLNDLARRNPPWADLDEWDNSLDVPTSFGYFACWLYHAQNSMRKLLRLVEDDPPLLNSSKYEEWQALDGAARGLDARLRQFDGLLTWARDTWNYDPKILKHMNPAPDEAPSPSQDCETSAHDSETAKSALEYLHAIHQWHDKYRGLTTLLELATAQQRAPELTSLSAAFDLAFRKLYGPLMGSLIYCRMPEEAQHDGEEEASEEKDDEQHLSLDDLQ